MVNDRLITVGCGPDRDRWRCEVRIGDDPDATRHQVTVRDEDLIRLAPAGTSDLRGCGRGDHQALGIRRHNMSVALHDGFIASWARPGLEGLSGATGLRTGTGRHGNTVRARCHIPGQQSGSERADAIR